MKFLIITFLQVVNILLSIRKGFVLTFLLLSIRKECVHSMCLVHLSCCSEIWSNHLACAVVFWSVHSIATTFLRPTLLLQGNAIGGESSYQGSHWWQLKTWSSPLCWSRSNPLHDQVFPWQLINDKDRLLLSMLDFIWQGQSFPTDSCILHSNGSHLQKHFGSC